MIDRFHAGNGFHLARLVLMNVLDQLGLGVGRAGDENGIGVGERFGDGVKILMIRGGMSAADRIGLVMNMPRRHVGMKDDLIEAGKTEMEDPGLQMVDPDDRVKMMLHDLDPVRWRIRARTSSFDPTAHSGHIGSLSDPI